MVKQGDIIFIDFNPHVGHEQSGRRPALVVSNNVFNGKTNMTILCPITQTKNKFPLHVELDSRTRTQGSVLCEHIKSMDIEERGYKVVERVPEDILKAVIDILISQVDY